jgi:hypothetical protein
MFYPPLHPRWRGCRAGCPLCLPHADIYVGERFDCFVEFPPFAIDHVREEAIIALLMHWVSAQCIERLERLVDDVDMI